MAQYSLTVAECRIVALNTIHAFVPTLCKHFICVLCVQGKVEMEIELLSAAEVEARPAGQGRDDPNDHPHLEAPK